MICAMASLYSAVAQKGHKGGGNGHGNSGKGNMGAVNSPGAMRGPGRQMQVRQAPPNQVFQRQASSPGQPRTQQMRGSRGQNDRGRSVDSWGAQNQVRPQRQQSVQQNYQVRQQRQQRVQQNYQVRQERLPKRHVEMPNYGQMVQRRNGRSERGIQRQAPTRVFNAPDLRQAGRADQRDRSNRGNGNGWANARGTRVTRGAQAERFNRTPDLGRLGKGQMNDWKKFEKQQARAERSWRKAERFDRTQQRQFSQDMRRSNRSLVFVSTPNYVETQRMRYPRYDRRYDNNAYDVPSFSAYSYANNIPSYPANSYSYNVPSYGYPDYSYSPVYYGDGSYSSYGPDYGYSDAYYGGPFGDDYGYQSSGSFDGDMNWTQLLLGTVVQALVGGEFSGDEFFAEPHYADYDRGYDPGYYEPPVYQTYYGSAQPYDRYIAYPLYEDQNYGPVMFGYVPDPYTDYSQELTNRAFNSGYQQGYYAGLSARENGYEADTYHDPYVYGDDGFGAYSISLSEQRQCLSQAYRRGYSDAFQNEEDIIPEFGAEPDLITTALSGFLGSFNI
ncbi:MAG: hypothetical protein ABI539_14340 [Acidobacteriota bacterium]